MTAEESAGTEEAPDVTRTPAAFADASSSEIRATNSLMRNKIRKRMRKVV